MQRHNLFTKLSRAWEKQLSKRRMSVFFLAEEEDVGVVGEGGSEEVVGAAVGEVQAVAEGLGGEGEVADADCDGLSE